MQDLNELPPPPPPPKPDYDAAGATNSLGLSPRSGRRSYNPSHRPQRLGRQPVDSSQMLQETRWSNTFDPLKQRGCLHLGRPPCLRRRSRRDSAGRWIPKSCRVLRDSTSRAVEKNRLTSPAKHSGPQAEATLAVTRRIILRHCRTPVEHQPHSGIRGRSADFTRNPHKCSNR